MCYCNSEKNFEECCKPLIKGEQKAKTAEQLMRSRYSAYVVADINYLLNTHHATTRPTKERKAILKWAKSVKWVKLEVLHTHKGLAGDKEGFVEFNAYYFDMGKMECIHENSYFVYENKQWYYKLGEHK